MSVSDPLLKKLKGLIVKLMPGNTRCPITDDDTENLQLLCEVLESILKKGFTSYIHSPFGLTKREYWSWIDLLRQNQSLKPKVSRCLDDIAANAQVTTSQGRGRLFIRYALHHKWLHIPIEHVVRSKFNEGMYSNTESILGDEILGEIFLSLLYQLMYIDFELQLKNASFLDDTWTLPEYKKLELVPSVDLGIFLGHVNGRAVVLRVEEGSVAAEDNKIEVGDAIDEVYGECIRGWRKSSINQLLRQNKGLPVSIALVKGHYKNGKLFSGLIPVLHKLQIDVNSLEKQFTELALMDKQDNAQTNFTSSGGYNVHYLGYVSVGSCGDVSRIEDGITSILNQNKTPLAVNLHNGEIGVQAWNRNNKKLIINHSYTEISSCGRRSDQPLYFAYISGDTTCSISQNFTCYVFKAESDNQSREILLTLADGFHRTHWAV